MVQYQKYSLYFVLLFIMKIIHLSERGQSRNQLSADNMHILKMDTNITKK